MSRGWRSVRRPGRVVVDGWCRTFGSGGWSNVCGVDMEDEASYVFLCVVRRKCMVEDGWSGGWSQR